MHVAVNAVRQRSVGSPPEGERQTDRQAEDWGVEADNEKRRSPRARKPQRASARARLKVFAFASSIAGHEKRRCSHRPIALRFASPPAFSVSSYMASPPAPFFVSPTAPPLSLCMLYYRLS